MDFVIALATEDGDQVHWTILDLFSESSRSELLHSLGVSRERFDQWRRSSRFDPIIPQFRSLSALGFIDDDAVALEPAALKEDCERAMRAATGAVTGEDARHLLLSLDRAANMASDARGRVEVFAAAGGERAGDSFSRQRV